MLQNSEMFMDMLKNKDKILSSILKDIDTSDKNMKSFEKLCALFEQGKEVNTEKALTACAKSIKHMNDMNRRMLIVLLVYTAGNNFSSDSASVLVKLGRGEEALREIFKSKMAGR